MFLWVMWACQGIIAPLSQPLMSQCDPPQRSLVTNAAVLLPIDHPCHECIKLLSGFLCLHRSARRAQVDKLFAGRNLDLKKSTHIFQVRPDAPHDLRNVAVAVGCEGFWGKETLPFIFSLVCGVKVTHDEVSHNNISSPSRVIKHDYQ